MFVAMLHRNVNDNQDCLRGEKTVGSGPNASKDFLLHVSKNIEEYFYIKTHISVHLTRSSSKGRIRTFNLTRAIFTELYVAFLSVLVGRQLNVKLAAHLRGVYISGHVVDTKGKRKSK